MKIAECFGANLKRWRVHRKLSKVDLAQRARIDRSMITEYEAGTTNVRIDTLYALATALSVPPRFLLEENLE